ncbi:PREDICTED: SH3 domain-containing YSC84-like protein 1 [Cyprinodon variegatus]|uniref:SH3 domain-containing YSC84-like protein 1 n=1 Tax=Cyprinodon variegatus TaxID=28743 RepID=UPI000742617D|nr:PREDICTED: SH3 domain-containing YSC84-like protein 1 [Cyprinodon variegatus]
MNPIPCNLKSEAKKAAKILRDFTQISNRTGPDKLIPAHIIAKAEGLAIISVIKAGFMVTARGGSGVVIARLADRRWSAPSAIGIAGLGGGFEIGVEVTQAASSQPQRYGQFDPINPPSYDVTVGGATSSLVVTATHPFTGQQPGDLSFVPGDRITVITKTDSQYDWWEGKLDNGNVGIFPANFVTY